MKLLPQLLTVGSLLTVAALGADKYDNYAELARHEKLGRDYQISMSYKKHPISVFAIHGGGIEFFTSELTQLTAGKELNAYYFEGIKSNNNWDLHITAHHFDEPNAVNLAKNSEDCLAMHGFAENNRSILCIGANNVKLGKLIAQSVKASRLPIQVEIPCTRFPGTYETNIVNRCRNKGVQLEMSGKLRSELRASPTFAVAYVNSIRKALSVWMQRRRN